MATYAALEPARCVFVFANFVSILHRRQATPPALHARPAARDAAGILSLLLLALLGRRRPMLPMPSNAGHARSVRPVCWLLIALLAFVGFGGWYNHYTLPVMLPGAVAAAAFFQRRARSGHGHGPAVPLALLFVAGQKILLSERARRGTAAEFDGTLADAVGRGPGGLFVYSGPVLLYPATGRPALTRYLFPSHLEFGREAGSIGVDQRAEIGRIFAQAPAVVVLAPADQRGGAGDPRPGPAHNLQRGRLSRRRAGQAGARATCSSSAALPIPPVDLPAQPHVERPQRGHELRVVSSNGLPEANRLPRALVMFSAVSDRS